MTALRLPAAIVIACAVCWFAPAAAQINTGVAAWKIDPVHSQATFAVRHLVVSTVRGKLGPVTGTVWYDGADAKSIRVEASIDAKGINTGDEARDKDLRGADFFAVTKYPALTFKSTSAVSGPAGHLKLVGNLTIRDVTKEVSLDVEGPSPTLKLQREERVAATATTKINRFDFGLKWNNVVETGAVVVGPEVSITLDVEVIRPRS